MAPVSLNFIYKQSRSFEETDKSEIERKSTWSIIALLLSEALPGYDLLKMTIVLIRSSGIWTRREVNAGIYHLPPVQNVKVSI